MGPRAILWALLVSSAGCPAQPAFACQAVMAPDPGFKTRDIAPGLRLDVSAPVRGKDGEGALVADGLFSYEDLAKALIAGDDTGVRHLVDGGRAWFVPNGTSVLVIETKNFTKLHAAEVRILDGRHKDKVAWIPAGWLTRLVPPPDPSEGARREAEARLAAGRRWDAMQADYAARKRARDSRAISNRPASRLSQARALERAGNRPGALAFYRALAKDFPGTPEAKEAAARIVALGGE